MLVKKKTTSLDWYIASFYVLIADWILYISIKDVVNLYVLMVAEFLIAFISIYIVVWMVMRFFYRKGYNFFTSPRFKKERKTVAGIIMIVLCVFIITYNLDIRNGRALDVFIEERSFFYKWICVIYFFHYLWLTSNNLKNSYYDDSLE